MLARTICQFICLLLLVNFSIAKVYTGADLQAKNGWKFFEQYQKIGILANPTATVQPEMTHVVDSMVSRNVDLVAVFAPEHGFRGDLQDGLGDDKPYVDQKTGVKVFPTYGIKLDKIKERVIESNIRAFVFDIQDAGVRFYTFIWSLYQMMEVCDDLNIPVVILDRPNPLGGQSVSGPVITNHPSFVGLKSIAIQHGMTVGELAQFFNSQFLGDRLNVEVIKMSGWNRGMTFSETGLNWVPTSPNIPTPEVCQIYAGTGFIEATLVSEGRGTTLPFKTFGAPQYYNNSFVDTLSQYLKDIEHVTGKITLREDYFIPVFSKHIGKLCRGVEAYVDGSLDDMTTFGVAVLSALRKHWPENEQFWRSDNWIGYLSGVDYIQPMVENGSHPLDIRAQWTEELLKFKAVRTKFLLY